MHLLRYAKKYTLIVLLGIILTIWGMNAYGQQQNSVLSTGEWLKIPIIKSGIYQIDAEDLSAAGWDVAKLNPGGFRLYGNGGKILPQYAKEPRQADLIENAIWVTGEADGKLDPSDRIYFYGEGAEILHFDTFSKQIKHEKNFYSDTAYYFLTWTETPGLRVKESPNWENTTEDAIVNEYTDYHVFEKESVNLLESGREWWGDYIATRPKGWQVKLSDIIPGRTAQFTNQVIAGAFVETVAAWSVNGVGIGNQNISAVPQGRYALQARKSRKSYTFQTNPVDDILYFEVNYDRKGQNAAMAYLDYFSVQLDRQLHFSESQQRFLFLPQQNDKVQYLFRNSTSENFILWDVTDSSLRW
jgi:hypothetical protein